MMTPTQFYLGHYDSSDPFGNLRPSGNRHLGSDFNGMPAGTEIPSWCEGTVVANGYSVVIGWYLIIRTKHGGWAGFYHMQSQSPLGVGSSVSFGQFIGYLGNTGTSSLGAHLHVMWSTRDGSAGTGNVDDPWPAIQTIIGNFTTGTAGGGITPFPTPIEEEELMATEMVWIVARASDDAALAARLGTPALAESVWYQPTPGSPVCKLNDNYRNSSEYTQLAQMRGPEAKDVYTAIAGNDILKLADKYGLVKSYAAGTVNVGDITLPTPDNSELIAAIKANKPPTAAEIAKALLDLEAARLAS